MLVSTNHYPHIAPSGTALEVTARHAPAKTERASYNIVTDLASEWHPNAKPLSKVLRRLAIQRIRWHHHILKISLGNVQPFAWRQLPQFTLKRRCLGINAKISRHQVPCVKFPRVVRRFSPRSAR